MRIRQPWRKRRLDNILKKFITLFPKNSRRPDDEQEYKDLIEKCQDLDRHYIQPRYPNGFASGYPAEFYNQKIAKECIEYAKIIIGFVKEKIEEISSSK